MSKRIQLDESRKLAEDFIRIINDKLSHDYV